MKKSEFIRAVKHNVWNWPVVFNLSAGSAAAGFYLLGFFLRLTLNNMESQLLDTIFKLTAPVLVAMGFFVVAFETGKPFKARYLLHNMHTSWMSREVFFAITFLFFAVTDFIFPNPIIKCLAGAMAVGLLFSQGFMINHSCAVTAWNTPIMPFYFFSSGLYMGLGCLLIWSAVIEPHQRILILLVGLTVLIFDLTLWIAYLNHSADKSFRQATRKLRRSLTLVNTIGLGHCLPAVLLLVLIKASTSVSMVNIIINRLPVLIGIIIICGGIYRNSAILLIANYFNKLSAETLKRNFYHAEISTSR